MTLTLKEASNQLKQANYLTEQKEEPSFALAVAASRAARSIDRL